MKISGKNGQRVIIWVHTLTTRKGEINSYDGYYDIVDYGNCFAIVKANGGPIVEAFSNNLYGWRMQPNEIGDMGPIITTGLEIV